MASRISLIVSFLALLSSLPAVPQDQPESPGAASVDLTPAAEKSIERGLRWLHKNQRRNGSYGSGSAPVATTSLAGLAFLAGGHVPGRSIYGENVKKAAYYLLRNAGKSGYINEGAQRGMGGSGMHGHGYATAFLAELYGMTGDRPDIETDTIKEVLNKAVRVIERAQCRNGGWNYEPNPSYDEGSVTVTQVEALRAARNAGIKVNIKTIDKAVEYINKSTNSSGMTQYSLTSGGRTSFALTAAGMSVLNFLGKHDSPKITKGCKYLLRSLPGKGSNNSRMGAWGGWYFYGNYYATVAMNQQGGDYWRKWFPAIRDNLVKTQSGDGAWKNAESGSYGPAFGTGLALLILQMPYRYLPIHQAGSE